MAANSPPRGGEVCVWGWGASRLQVAAVGLSFLSFSAQGAGADGEGAR